MFLNTFHFSSNKVFVIAEIGVNHNGKTSEAIKLIDAAISAGADAVKFQSFSAEKLASSTTPKVDYQLRSGKAEESHLEMLKKLELSNENQLVLKEYCESKKILFFSTPYDVESALDLLSIGVPLYKTASADITDNELHQFIASTGRPVIIGTAMATLGEIEAVLKCYENYDKGTLALLHGVSNYPCSDESQNLNVIKTLIHTFGFTVGLTDHSEGYMSAVLSIALGARVVEKHFTLDKNADGPDHAASSNPEEFKEYVQMIRKAELLLGSPIKSRQIEENSMALTSRKSFHYSCDLPKGKKIERKDLTLMRPGTGLKFADIENILGKNLRRDVVKNSIVDLFDLE